MSRFARLGSSRGTNLRSVKRGIAGLATTVLVSGGLGLAALALAGAAQAQWCPGDPPNWAPRFATWDWSVCHNYHYVSDGVVDDDTGILYPYSGDPRPWVQPPLAPASSPGGPQCIGWYPIAIPIDGGDPKVCAL